MKQNMEKFQGHLGLQLVTGDAVNIRAVRANLRHSAYLCQSPNLLTERASLHRHLRAGSEASFAIIRMMHAVR
jgi:hypothetical protein